MEDLSAAGVIFSATFFAMRICIMTIIFVTPHLSNMEY